jgi:large exoprotein involved in heme utilization and adhesion
MIVSDGSFDGFDMQSKEIGNSPVMKLGYNAEQTCTNTGVLELANTTEGGTEYRRGQGTRVVMSFTLSSDTTNAHFYGFTVQNEGDLDVSQDIRSIELYIDGNNNGLAEANEKVSGLNLQLNGGEIRFTLETPLPVVAGTTRFLVTYQF